MGAAGDFFMGGKVTEVGDRLLSLDLAGKPRIMAKTDDFALVPLNKSAPFLTNQGQIGRAPAAPADRAASAISILTVLRRRAPTG